MLIECEDKILLMPAKLELSAVLLVIFSVYWSASRNYLFTNSSCSGLRT